MIIIDHALMNLSLSLFVSDGDLESLEKSKSVISLIYWRNLWTFVRKYGHAMIFRGKIENVWVFFHLTTPCISCIKIKRTIVTEVLR